MRLRVVAGFLVYGLVVGLLNSWWWGFSDDVFLLNVPGVLLGDVVYNLSIEYLGNPYSEQAHYTIPWVLRVPQVYVPVSLVFWGLVGMVVHVIYVRVREG